MRLLRLGGTVPARIAMVARGCKVTHHQLEGDAPWIDLGECTALGGLYRAVIDEHDAPLVQGFGCGMDVRCTEADAQQALLPHDVLGARGRLDELQVEAVTRTF